MTPAVVVGAMLGCGAGAVVRYLLGRIDHPWSFPWPTIVANALGSAVLGALAHLVLAGPADATWLAVGGAGFAGGLTTFSSLALDATVLWKDGRRRAAAAYLVATFAAGLAAAGLGWLAATPWS